MKRILSLVLCCVLMLSISLTAAAAGPFTPGTYEVSTAGHNGDFTVSVTFSEDAIVDIEIGENVESAQIGDYAMELIRNEIIQNQKIPYDAISGATISSRALTTAVSNAIKEAGANPNDYWESANTDLTPLPDAVADVVVVGSGSAGLAATIEAQEQGLNVILIEQLGILGGSSVRAGFMVGGGTKLQKEQGVEFSAEDLVAAYNKVSSSIDEGLYDEETLIRYYSEAGQNIDWLMDMGVPFANLGTTVGSHYAENGTRIGPKMVQALREVLDTRKIDYRLNTRAEEILMENGAVVGLRVEAPNGTEYTIHTPNVILCTGGYNASQAMIAEYNPAFVGSYADVCKGADGSGMKMAEAVGGVLAYMDQANYHGLATVWRGVSRSLVTVQYRGAIAVNEQGKRFVNERAAYEVVAFAVLDQEKAFCITNQTIMDIPAVQADVGLSANLAIYTVADTIEELAEKIGVDPQALAETVSTYGEYARNGEDLEFGKAASYMNSDFSEGPYYAVEVKPELHTVFGGIVVDADTHVLNADGQIIPGLYAAGEATCSHVQGNNSNTMCIETGRTAARDIRNTMSAELAA